MTILQKGTPLDFLGSVQMVSTGRTDPALMQAVNTIVPVQPIAGASFLRNAFTNNAAGLQLQAAAPAPDFQPAPQLRTGLG